MKINPLILGNPKIKIPVIAKGKWPRTTAVILMNLSMEPLNIKFQSACKKAADSTAKSLVIRDVAFDVAAPVAKVTGKKEFFFLGYDREPTLKITQTAPLPLKVLGVALEVVF